MTGIELVHPFEDRRRREERRESVRLKAEAERARQNAEDMRRITREVVAFLFGIVFCALFSGLFS